MRLEFGQRVRIKGDSEDNVYAVRGIDPVSGRVWICVEQGDFAGYDGGVILAPRNDGTFGLALSDARSSLSHHVELTPV